MKGKFWKGILILVMAGLSIAAVLQVVCRTKEPQEQDPKIKLLAQNDWLSFRGTEEREGRYTTIEYRLNYYQKEEVVYIFIGGKYFTDEQNQSYYIYGKGDEILRIEWRQGDQKVEVSVPDIKSEPDLPAEAIKLLVERGTYHYFATRKYFRVDTYEEAKKMIEEKNEQLKKDLEKIVK